MQGHKKVEEVVAVVVAAHYLQTVMQQSENSNMILELLMVDWEKKRIDLHKVSR